MDIMIDLIHISRISVSTLVDMEGRCPLMYASGEGHLAVCQWLVEYADADYHRQDDRGRSCLIYACRSGQVEIIEWLLTIVTPQPTYTGWHPLHYACSAGYLNAVKVLLKNNKQSAHVLTNTGHSALFMAMHSTDNTYEIVKCLIDSDPLVQLTLQDIEDLNCDLSLIILLAQRRHSLTYLFDIIERMNYSLLLIHLLLLSEHKYSSELLLSISQHQSFIRHQLRTPLKLKHIIRCFIRKSIDNSQKIDLLEINHILKKFLRFECLY